MKNDCFLPGIDVLTDRHGHWLSGRRIGLLTHPAALDSHGRHSVTCLLDAGARLTALFGPEHGFFGAAGAGDNVRGRKHPTLGIPVYSLYGEHRRPTPNMLRHVDTVLVDLQDLGVRCYTYVSTLRLVMEAARDAGKEVIVADRPIPLPTVIDGPVTVPACESFIAALPVPLVYGMTPGETATWMHQELFSNVDLKIAPMMNYTCEPGRGVSWPPWIPPSPGIVSWESASCYPATVLTEAFPQIDHGARTGLSFQVLGATWMDGPAVCETLHAFRLPGIAFHPHLYPVRSGEGPLVNGVRLTVNDPVAFRPAQTAVAILSALQTVCGSNRIWRNRRTRAAFLDKLMGTPQVREDLLTGAALPAVRRQWQTDLRAFRRSRQSALLYPRPASP